MLNQSQKTKLDEYKSGLTAENTAKSCLKKLFDDGEYSEIGATVKSGENLSAVVTAYGFIDGSPVYAFSQDDSVNGGAVNAAQAEKICKIYDLAAKNGVPVVGVYNSIGAYISDGAKILSAYGKMLELANNLSGVVPQISVIVGSCVGSSAMIAASADFVIATEKSEIYLTANQNASGKDAAESGIVNLVAKDNDEAFDFARKVVSTLPANNIAAIPEFEYAETALNADGNASEIAAAISDVDSLIEISAEFGKSSYTAISRIGGAAVGIIATNKTADKLTSEDCEKIVRFVRICDAYSVPIVTVVDTEGFDNGTNIRKISRVAGVYAEATTLKISLISGKAYGSAAVAFASANADVTYSYANAVVTPLAPLTAVEFLNHDALKGADNTEATREKLAAEYAENDASAFAAAENNFVDEIIDSAEARKKIINVLEVMSDKRLAKKLPKKHSI